jgi:hypothetical protein
MHLVKLIERRFPNRKGGILGILVFLSISLVVGLGLLLMQ